MYIPARIYIHNYIDIAPFFKHDRLRLTLHERFHSI